MFIALISALSLNVAVAQSAIGEPKNFCYKGCSAEQVKIWEAFEQAAFSTEAALPALYKGSCYHLASGHKNTYPHHGVFYMSEVNGRTHASARFKFFGESYDDMRLEDAEAEFPKHLDSSRILAALEKSHLLDLSSKETPWRYWLRHSADRETVFVVGQWGLFHLLFCELKK